MTDSSLPAGLIEAVARGIHPGHGTQGKLCFYCLDPAKRALSAAFSWCDDKPCGTCGGTPILGMCLGCEGSGRVEGDRRVILARQVPDLGLHGHAQYIDGIPFGSNVKAGEGYHGTFPLDPDDEPVFRFLPSVRARTEDGQDA